LVGGSIPSSADKETMDIQDLHLSLKYLPRISPILLMRKTRHNFEYCIELCKKINVLRDAEGLNRKKWSRIK
jgi:hypothetical protein